MDTAPVEMDMLDAPGSNLDSLPIIGKVEDPNSFLSEIPEELFE